ncbi:hypothetical protein LJB42_001658 [Komagataella kurtzmanii]|nr:hypothetical protein LJB42_001658 [Komagataella kurtzmanii]
MGSSQMVLAKVPYSRARHCLELIRRQSTAPPLSNKKEGFPKKLSQLRSESLIRNMLRVTKPDMVWRSKMFPKDTLSAQSSLNTIQNALVSHFGKVANSFKVSACLHTHISVGDVIALTPNVGTRLAVVVQIPNSPSDPRYTLITDQGEILFLSSLSSKLRFPQVFPTKWLRNLVIPEEISDLPPVGNPKAALEEPVDSSLLTASSSKVNTFISAKSPTKIITKYLVNFMAEAWKKLPELNMKLEFLHNLLQSSEGPYQIGVFELLDACNRLDLNKVATMLTSGESPVNVYQKIAIEVFGEDYTFNYLPFHNFPLGKNVQGSFESSKNINISAFLSLILCLRKNSKLYKHSITSVGLPLEVTIIPLPKVVEQDRILLKMKEDKTLLPELVRYIDSKIRGDTDLVQPDLYPQVINLLKDYSGNDYSNLPLLESLIVRILRNTHKFKNDFITRSTVYELLTLLKEIELNTDPTEWSNELAKPHTNVSETSTQEQNYYDNLEFKDTTDPLGKIRKTFNDTIYTIDGADALEIDDGVSITENGDNWTIRTHIADPGSRLDLDSTLSKIGFRRAYTHYFPDTNDRHIPMLPRSFVKNVELTKRDQPVRTMCFELSYNTKKNKIESEKTRIYAALETNFVKLTYDEVDEILKGNDSFLEELSKKHDISKEKLSTDIHRMFTVSTNLKNHRFKKGALNFSPISKRLVKVEKVGEELSLIFDNQSFSKSQILVSELMIATNASVGEFCARRKIPSIYRIIQSKQRAPEVIEMFRQSQTCVNVPLTQRIMMMNFMGLSSFSSTPRPHESLGISRYCTVTSPLRRFTDLAIHWQLQSFLLNDKELLFTPANLDYIILHLKFKEHQIRSTMDRSKAFFTFRHLSQFKGDQQTFFKCVFLSNVSSAGTVEVSLLDYGVRCTLKRSDEKSHPGARMIGTLKIGDIIEDAYVEDIDLLEGNLLLRSPSCI